MLAKHRTMRTKARIFTVGPTLTVLLLIRPPDRQKRGELKAEEDWQPTMVSIPPDTTPTHKKTF